MTNEQLAIIEEVAAAIDLRCKAIQNIKADDKFVTLGCIKLILQDSSRDRLLGILTGEILGLLDGLNERLK